MTLNGVKTTVLKALRVLSDAIGQTSNYGHFTQFVTF